MPCALKDGTRLEVRVNRGVTLNQVFEKLSDKGLMVESMRNKSNRIEELFIDLVSSKKETTKA